jgi:hypothetical protein
MEVKQGYVLRVNVCLTTNGGEPSVRVGSECLTANGGEARVSVESECISNNERR